MSSNRFVHCVNAHAAVECALEAMRQGAWIELCDAEPALTAELEHLFGSSDLATAWLFVSGPYQAGSPARLLAAGNIEAVRTLLDRTMSGFVG
ncbi:MAG: hypothetical protein ACREB3_06950 [Burkholderiales bacterium]